MPRKPVEKPIKITVGVLRDLYQDDKILADKACDRFSLNTQMQRNAQTNPESEYELFSDRFHRDYKGYELDAQNRLRPCLNTEKANFDDLKKSLL